MNFDLPRDNASSIIKVIGVGGGGCNAVDHMYRQGIKGVDFAVCNTDQQALDKSPVPNKIILGATLTEGLGAGSNPEVGKNSAIESMDEIKAILGTKTKMVFITAGMGGGTGTGAAPVIAAIAKEMGILTVAIVTIPFGFEGKRRKTQAEDGVEELKRNVDTLLIICNDKLREIYGNLKMTDAFGHADNILTTGAKGIAEIITEKLHVNTDFADIQTVLKDSGVAIMGSAEASGEGRALKAVEMAMTSPLLNDSNIKGARHVLLNIKCGSGDNEISMDEFGEITDFLQESAGGTAEVIQGYGIDDAMGDRVIVTIIATGFNNKKDVGIETAKQPARKVTDLYGAAPVSNTVQVLAIGNTQPNIINKVSEVEPKAINDEPSIELELSNASEVQPVLYQLDKKEDTMPSSEEVHNQSPGVEISNEDLLKRSNDRRERLKSFSWKSNKSIDEMEETPAYIRKKVLLDNVPHSSESQVSRFTLGEDEDKNGKLNTNGNSFLHDNVD